jgi:hypothetical protein
MAGYGIAEAEIAKVIGVALNTLRKHCALELDTGHTVAIAKVAETLYSRATDRTGGSSTVTACIFWLKTRGGWRETVRNEHTGPDGAPIELIVDIRERIAGRVARLSAKMAARRDNQEP